MIWPKLTILLFAMAVTVVEVRAGETMTFVFQRDAADVNDYAWKALREALERTRETYGDFRLEASPSVSDRPRRLALEAGEFGININVFPDSGDIGDALLPVPIPVDRGMLGYRVLFIRAEDQEKFDRVKGFDDLAGFRFGSLTSWVDTRIMRDAGLTVVPGASHDGLFHMLTAKRFDALNRSVTEVVQESKKFSGQLQDVAIERHLLLHYPIPSYFWVVNNAQGKLMAERVQAGLGRMVEDGTLQAFFNAEFHEVIAALDLDHRLVIDLPNATLRTRDPLEDPRLWYEPRHAYGSGATLWAAP